MNTNTSTQTSYSVAIATQKGSYFSPNGYSKYNERLALFYKDRLPKSEEPYGLAQALDHIEELKASVYNGKQHYKDAKFEIRVVTTIVTTIEL